MEANGIRIDVRAHPGASRALREYARTKVETVLRHTDLPVLSVRVLLDRSPDPAVARPAHASVAVDLNGTLVLAKADAATATEAIDLMRDRLSARLSRAGRS